MLEEFWSQAQNWISPASIDELKMTNEDRKIPAAILHMVTSLVPLILAMRFCQRNDARSGKDGPLGIIPTVDAFILVLESFLLFWLESGVLPGKAFNDLACKTVNGLLPGTPLPTLVREGTRTKVIGANASVGLGQMVTTMAIIIIIIIIIATERATARLSPPIDRVLFMVLHSDTVLML